MTAPLGPDPLVRPTVDWPTRLRRGAAIALAAAVAHVAATGAISGISWAIGLTHDEQDDDPDPVEVAIVETRPEPPPPAPEPDPPTLTPDPAPSTPATTAPPPEPPKPDRPRKRRAPPPPDPIDAKDAPPPNPDAPPVRRTVGLNLESTVTGGSGPAFATGNTRMGATERTAKDPKAIDRRREAPPKTPPPPSPNQVAQSIPGSKAVLVKPKRKRRVEPAYPPLLRDRGIEGVVVVRVHLDARGSVTKVDIVAAAEHAAFNDAARAAALREQFNPATKNGTPIPFSVSFSYRFRLNAS